MSTTTTVYASATDEALRQALQGLPDAARGGGRIADAMMTRIGIALLGRIRKAFIDKARGGADEAGDTWKPLAKSTVAYSRRHRKLHGRPSESRAFSTANNKPWIPKAGVRAGYAPSYALTDRQNARWWELYRKYLAIYRNPGHAAAAAWIVSKAEGAHTLMELYGDARVKILRDTGLLLNSLSPGVRSKDQVFRVGLGEVIVGTNRKWASVHHHGSRDGRIPQRRLWPPVPKWPHSWWIDMLEQAWGGMIDLAKEIIRRV